MYIVIPIFLDNIFGADFTDNGKDSTAGGGGGCCMLYFIRFFTISLFKMLSKPSAL